jgi:hypothetical protein
MTLDQLVLICFAIGIGVWAVVDHPTINLVAKWVGGLGGIIYGLLLIFRG